jgi:phosphopantetheinyl transferase
MPLILKQKTPEGAEWAAWHITESEDFLRQAITITEPELLVQLAPIRVAQRRLEWLASRLALQALGPEELSPAGLLKLPSGRPYFAELNVQVSLAHAWPYAVAIIHNQTVGIDIELPRTQLSRIQHKFVSEEEAQWAAETPNLCRLWTAKEALYKAYGQPGIGFASQMRVHLPPAGGAELLGWGFVNQQQFTLRWQQLGEHHCCLAL